MHVTSSIITLTPAKAQRLLDNMVCNRKLDIQKVEDYTRAIKDGRWQVSGQGIILTQDGRMLDGQHRCQAVIRSGQSIQILEVRGVQLSAFDVMDDGKKRSAADVVGLRGIANAKTTASILPYLWREKHGVALNGWARMSLREASQLIDQNTDVAVSAHWVVGNKGRIGKRACGGVLGYAHWKAGRINIFNRDEFFARFSDGVGLGANSPILRLREGLLAAEHNPATELGSIILAWNKYHTGTGRFCMYDSSKMDFPAWSV